jgi:hypothetical protein
MRGIPFNFRRPLKVIGYVLFCGFLFVALTIGEEYLRSLQAKPIPVELAPGLPVSVSASQRPDFHWAGVAWHIEVESTVPVELEVDGRTRIHLSVGKTTIYSNHDVSNTSDYGLGLMPHPPTRISVKPSPSPATH